MKDDPIVSEVRRVREALWQEAGCDLGRLAELARQGAAGLPNPGPRIEDAAALRHFVEQQENAAAALREQPPPYAKGSGEKP